MTSRHTHTGAAAVLMLGLVVGLAALSGCERERVEPVVLARVGDAELTVEDLRRYVPEELLLGATREDIQSYANQWVRAELLYHAALDMGYGGDERVRERMREVERDLVVDVYLQDELDMQAFISEAEIEAYHADNQDAFRRASDEVRFMAIWVPERAMADRVRTVIREGATFDEAAADSSIVLVGIELGEQFYTREELEEGVAETAFTLAPGSVSRVVPLEGQFAVLRVEDRQEAGTVRSLWEVRDDIEARLAADLRESKLESMLTELLQRNDVSLNVDGALRALHNPRTPR